MPKAIDLRRRARAGAGASAIRYSKSIDYSHATAGVVVAATGGASLVGGGGVGGGALGRGASETDLLLDTSSASSTATSMTSREMREYRTLFDILDEDQSGAIGKDELKEAFSRVGTIASDEAIDALINEIDADGSGEIDFNEFCGCLRRLKDLCSFNDDFARACFQVLAQDSGVITRNNFIYIAKEIGGFAYELAQSTWEELDVSHLGYIDESQFAAIVDDYMQCEPSGGCGDGGRSSSPASSCT